MPPSGLGQAATALSGDGASTALIVSFVIQQAIEIVDSLVAVLFNTDQHPERAGKKKALLKLCSLGLGIIAAKVLGIDVAPGSIPQSWHWLISSIALAGGTEGVNSILKYIGYAKENKKNDAAAKLDPAKTEQLKTVGRK